MKKGTMAALLLVVAMCIVWLGAGPASAQSAGYGASTVLDFTHPSDGPGRLFVSVNPDPILLARVDIGFFPDGVPADPSCTGSRGVGLTGTTAVVGLPLTGSFLVDPALTYALLQPTSVTCAGFSDVVDLEIGVEWREQSELQVGDPTQGLLLFRSAIATGLPNTALAGSVGQGHIEFRISSDLGQVP